MANTCELDCKSRLKVCNEHGEIPDCGPPWACAGFGSPGHNYQTCDRCHETFESYLNRNHIAEARL